MLHTCHIPLRASDFHTIRISPTFSPRGNDTAAGRIPRGLGAGSQRPGSCRECVSGFRVGQKGSGTSGMQARKNVSARLVGRQGHRQEREGGRLHVGGWASGPQGRPWFSRVRSLGHLFGTLPRALLGASELWGTGKILGLLTRRLCPEHDPGLIMLCLGFLLCKMGLHFICHGMF